MTEPQMQVGSVTLHSRSASAPCFFLQSVEDWYTLPDSKAPSVSIPNQHGDFDGGPDWSEAAVLTVTGLAKATSRSELIGLMQQLNGTRSLVAQTPMTLLDDAGSTTRMVSVRRIKWADMGKEVSCGFTLYAQAPDPFRYGADVVTSTGLPVSGGGLAFPVAFPIDFGSGGLPGQMVLTNAGTQATWTRFTVSGGLAGGFSLIFVELGREIRFEFPLSVTDVVTIDQKTGRAWINDESNSVTGFLTKSEWADVPPGGSLTVQFNAIGASTGTPIATGYTPPANL